MSSNSRSWLIGCAPECDVVLTQETISGHHCRLSLTSNGYILEDLCSTNGTYVDGVRIVKPTRVQSTNLVTLGTMVPLPWNLDQLEGTTHSNGSRQVIRIGHGEDNDIVLNDSVVSRHHARIIIDDKGVTIEDLGSTNGTFLGSRERRIATAPILMTDTVIFGTLSVPVSRLIGDRKRDSAEKEERPPVLLLRGESMILGRDPDCDRCIDLPTISGRHARLTRSGDYATINDLGSSNGTTVNGQRISGATAIFAGDRIGLGNYFLVMGGVSSDEATREIPPVAKVPVAGAGEFPILRFRHRFFATDVIAIYNDHMVAGSCRFRRRAAMTEEMCRADGEEALTRLLTRFDMVDFDEVLEVREEAPKSGEKSWKRSLTARTPARFTIRLFDHNIGFEVPISQVLSVRAVLRAKLAGRYLVAKPRSLSASTAVTILVIGAVFLGLGLLAAGSGLLVGSIVIAIVGLIPFSTGLVRLLHDGREWLTPEEVKPSPPPLPPRKASKSFRMRHPLRSAIFGRTLKTIGVVYWILYLSPVRNYLTRYLPDAFDVQYLVLTLGFAPVPLLIYWGYRLCQTAYEPTERGDTRRPILFLRPFEEDSMTSFQPEGMLARVTGVSSVWRSNIWSGTIMSKRIGWGDLLMNCLPVRLVRMIFNSGAATSEESLVRYFETFGPVIAIGKPGEGMATPGAARMYVPDNRWQETIRDELRRSQAIVVLPGTSPGVLWELEQIREHVEPYRILFCLVGYWKNPQGYEELIRLVETGFRVQLPRVVPFLDRPAFLLFDREWNPYLQEMSYKSPILWPVTADATDLLYTLHPFVQGIHGGEREPPRPPRFEGSLRSIASALTAILLSGIVAFIPYFIVNFVYIFILIMFWSR